MSGSIGSCVRIALRPNIDRWALPAIFRRGWGSCLVAARLWGDCGRIFDLCDDCCFWLVAPYPANVLYAAQRDGSLAPSLQRGAGRLAGPLAPTMYDHNALCNTCADLARPHGAAPPAHTIPCALLRPPCCRLFAIIRHLVFHVRSAPGAVFKHFPGSQFLRSSGIPPKLRFRPVSQILRDQFQRSPLYKPPTLHMPSLMCMREFVRACVNVFIGA